MSIECTDPAMCAELGQQVKQLLVTVVTYSLYVIVPVMAGYVGIDVYRDWRGESV